MISVPVEFGSSPSNRQFLIWSIVPLAASWTKADLDSRGSSTGREGERGRGK